jgi:hypothetical protein
MTVHRLSPFLVLLMVVVLVAGAACFEDYCDCLEATGCDSELYGCTD